MKRCRVVDLFTAITRQPSGGRSFCVGNALLRKEYSSNRQAQAHQLIWRGSLEGNVSDPKRPDKEVDKGIHKIMKDYPLKPSKS